MTRPRSRPEIPASLPMPWETSTLLPRVHGALETSYHAGDRCGVLARSLRDKARELGLTAGKSATGAVLLPPAEWDRIVGLVRAGRVRRSPDRRRPATGTEVG